MKKLLLILVSSLMLFSCSEDPKPWELDREPTVTPPNPTTPDEDKNQGNTTPTLPGEHGTKPKLHVDGR